MDMEENADALWSKCEGLRQENNQLKTMVRVLKENADLRANLQSFNLLDELTETKPPGQWQKSLEESQFRKDLQQKKTKKEHRTSSPVDFTSFMQSSMHTDAKEQAQLQSCNTETSPDVNGLSNLFGEIAYQLDRRILSYVFQGQKRLYGFTVLNIPHKIIDVSKHPLTGRVDEGYRLFLTQRYSDLMTALQQMGYKAALHPPFTEFIVNTFGILKERPDDHSRQDVKDPNFLRTVIVKTAPPLLQKDLLIVLTCLCSMAERDRKPLFVW